MSTGAHPKPPDSSLEAPSPYNLILLRSWDVHAEDEETGKGHGGSSKIWTQEKVPGATLRTTAVQQWNRHQENSGNDCMASAVVLSGAFCPGQGLGSGCCLFNSENLSRELAVLPLHFFLLDRVSSSILGGRAIEQPQELGHLLFSLWG